MTEEKPPRSAGMLTARPMLRPQTLMGFGGVASQPRWRAQVLTLYPDMFPGPLEHSLTGAALKKGLWGLEALDIRRFARDKHRSVDDTPAGGGPGMVLRADIVASALDFATRDAPRTPDGEIDRDKWAVIALTPRGRPMSQARARQLAAGEGATFLCGRFEGIDQRALDARGVEEIGVGDFVLTGGEIPAMAVIDAAVRLLPGVLGKIESTQEESFSAGLLEHPQYTRPQVWEEHAIPEILLSGHHGEIAKWRRAQAEAVTKERRPDLWRAHLKAGDGPTGGAEQSDGESKKDQGS